MLYRSYFSLFLSISASMAAICISVLVWLTVCNACKCISNIVFDCEIYHVATIFNWSHRMVQFNLVDWCSSLFECSHVGLYFQFKILFGYCSKWSKYFLYLHTLILTWISPKQKTNFHNSLESLFYVFSKKCFCRIKLKTQNANPNVDFSQFRCNNLHENELNIMQLQLKAAIQFVNVFRSVRTFCTIARASRICMDAIKFWWLQFATAGVFEKSIYLSRFCICICTMRSLFCS